MSEKKKIVLTAALTAVITCVITLALKEASELFSFGNSDADFAKKITAVDMLLDKEYLYDYDKAAIRETAVKAYVDGLNEPYTRYYTPSEFSSYINNIQDGYTGIGVIVTVNENNQIVVIAPYEDSPAYSAGVLPGDILKAVEGVEYSGDRLSEAVDAIRGGKEGTSVNITFARDGEDINLTIERRDISSDSVKSEMLSDDIGYIRITSFNAESENGDHSTSSEFESALEQLMAQNAKRLIIDLRDNPGGVLTEVCDIADRLLPEGLITYVEDKNGTREDYTSDADYIDLPIAVLINGNSASASEVLTGALKDYDRAVVVGEKSYGKGIVQQVYPFFDGSGVSVTIAKYYTPNGICVHETGIEPNVTVAMPEKYKNKYISEIEHSEDVQLNKAIELVKERK